MKAWSGRVAHDYDSLWIFDCPAYYHIKEDKLDPRAKKSMFIGFKKDVKGNKIWNLKDRKFFLKRDIMYEEVSMMKLIDSQQVRVRRLTGYCSR